MAKSKSSKKWLAEHFDDHYVKLAQQQGLRSRSAFKLLELQEKYGLIRASMSVVDLGAAPGGWSQVARRLVGASGKVIALDILAMDPLQDVVFLQADFTGRDALELLERVLDGREVDLVLSDMAPNMSGVTVTDQAKAMYLAELALGFARTKLMPGGGFVVKLFQGVDFDNYVREARSMFEKVRVVKPKASRPRSREVYLLAEGRRLT
ncbi:MAG: 23S rRNA (uridine(2552)-2'-O)-methyltransferase RlmE [Xanthomonadales bacterium]|nr:23S rRNA (uridine(2552)-2'-O)-methyltransferase RlmE [Xanthomonadales bacterium]